MFVTVVPMFAPMIMGTAASTDRTPDPTSPTIVAVDTDDDWTRTVARMPAKRPAIGLATLVNSPSAKSLPKTLMPDSRDLTPTRKR